MKRPLPYANDTRLLNIYIHSICMCIKSAVLLYFTATAFPFGWRHPISPYGVAEIYGTLQNIPPAAIRDT